MYIRTRGPISILFSLVITAVVGFFVYTKVDNATKQANAVESSVLSQVGVTNPGSLQGDPDVAAGSSLSLFRVKNFRKAVAIAEHKLGANASFSVLRLDPGKLTLTTSSGVFIVGARGESGSAGSGIDTSAGENDPLESIDPAAPARMLAKTGDAPSNVDYFAFTPAASLAEWTVFTRDGHHYRANAHGRKVVPF